MSKNEKGRYVKAVIQKDNKKGINDETINRHYQPKKNRMLNIKLGQPATSESPWVNTHLWIFEFCEKKRKRERVILR